MQSPPVLAYYDVNAPVTLSVDASSHALGAVLLQNGRPVAYASKALTPCEENYPQIEKEAAAIRFACRKFHQYIYGKEITIETDHKPLESIFRKPLDRAPPRLRRIRLEVTQYNPKVVYVKGKDIPIPDILSRDVENTFNQDEDEQIEVHVVLQMSKQSSTELRHHMEQDYDMQSLKEVIMQGWPDQKESVVSELRKYWCFRDELAVYNGLIFKAHQVLIPKSLQKKMLNLIHSGHPGQQSSLRRAKQVLFWINMANDIQEMVENCTVCQHNQRSNVKNTVISKDVPELPFERVASDLFSFKGQEYLLLVDSYSGFFDMKALQDTKSSYVIKALKDWFAVHGIPKVLETDNGPQYACEMFRTFSQQWGFEHVTSSPHFPRANGLAERYVQTAKAILNKCSEDQSDVQLALLHARNTPRSHEIPSPNERLMGRLVRTNIPMTLEALKPKATPNIQELLQRERLLQKDYADRGAKEAPAFNEQEKILIQDHQSKRWTEGTVLRNLPEQRSYLVKKGDRILRRNSHHLKKLPGVVERDDADPSTSNNETVSQTDDSTTTQPTMNTSPRATTTRSGRVVKACNNSDYEYY